MLSTVASIICQTFAISYWIHVPSLVKAPADRIPYYTRHAIITITQADGRS
jgi:hypothetical protein